MSQLEILIASILLALTVGFGTGYYVKGKMVDAAEVSSARKDAKDSAANVVKSVEQSQTVAKKIDLDNAAVDRIADAVTSRTSKYQPRPSKADPHASLTPTKPATPDVVCPPVDLVLDAGTVRLLNSASKGGAVDSTGDSDGKKQASSDDRR